MVQGILTSQIKKDNILEGLPQGRIVQKTRQDLVSAVDSQSKADYTAGRYPVWPAVVFLGHCLEGLPKGLAQNALHGLFLSSFGEPISL